jgi:enoyl reductase-like protein
MSKVQVPSFSEDLEITMLAVCAGDFVELDFGGFEIASGVTARVQCATLLLKLSRSCTLNSMFQKPAILQR